MDLDVKKNFKMAYENYGKSALLGNKSARLWMFPRLYNCLTEQERQNIKFIEETLVKHRQYGNENGMIDSFLIMYNYIHKKGPIG